MSDAHGVPFVDDAGDTASRAAEAVARRSRGRLLAFLAARSRDIAAAEDALSEAFAAALAHWPAEGVPHNPEAWLLTAARRKLIDAARRQGTQAEAADELLVLAQPGFGDAAPLAIPDERLRLLFACAHPGIAPALRAPLMLQTVLGLDAAAIGQAFRVPPATMGQRLVRGKARIREAGIPFRVPEPHELPDRLDAVLAAVYAAYSEGWCDPGGAQPQRRTLAEEALWLGRLIASLLPAEPEALGLLALMLYLESRRLARRDAAGEFVPLAVQDTQLWDAAQIDEAERALRLAASLGRPGRYQLEAAVQSAHARPRGGGPADWPAVVQLYDALQLLTGSPVVAINRAVALSRTAGAEAGLRALQAVADDPRVTTYQPYWAARADLLAQTGHTGLALAAYQQAIGLEIDPAVRRFLQRRSAALQR